MIVVGGRGMFGLHFCNPRTLRRGLMVWRVCLCRLNFCNPQTVGCWRWGCGLHFCNPRTLRRGVMVCGELVLGLHFCNPQAKVVLYCWRWGGMGYTNGKNELKAFVGRVEMAMPFNPSKPLNSFNPKI